jgi:hypothetical protein
VPFLLSPLVGWLVDLAGFEVVFFSAMGLIGLSGLLTFRLEEPRYKLEDVQPRAFPGTPEE